MQQFYIADFCVAVLGSLQRDKLDEFRKEYCSWRVCCSAMPLVSFFSTRESVKMNFGVSVGRNGELTWFYEQYNYVRDSADKNIKTERLTAKVWLSYARREGRRGMRAREQND